MNIIKLLPDLIKIEEGKTTVEILEETFVINTSDYRKLRNRMRAVVGQVMDIIEEYRI